MQSESGLLTEVQAQGSAKSRSMKDASELVSYLANDGVQASMRVFRARSAGVPVLVCLPAMGVRGSYYAGLARALNDTGLHAVTSDLRGVGSSSLRASRSCDFGYKEMLSLDLPALIAQARACFPESKLVLLGHSLGGQLSALHLSKHPEAAEGLILIAACNVHYKGWPPFTRWRVLGFALLLRGLGALLGYVPAGRLGFAGNEARTVVVDWSNNCKTGRYLVQHSAHDYDLSLQQMTKPVLSISLEADKLAPPRSVANLHARLPRCAVTAKCFSANYPGLENAGHFDWAKRPEIVAETISAWIHDTGSR